CPFPSSGATPPPPLLAVHHENLMTAAAATATASSSLFLGALSGFSRIVLADDSSAMHHNAMAHWNSSSFLSSSLTASASSLSSSSFMLLSSRTLDQFTLPSYESAKGSTLIDLNAKVQDVNKRTLADAKAKWEYVDKLAEKAKMDVLQRIEQEEKKLFESMTKQSNAHRKARIKAEKAES
ncbi:hypothetical protein ACHAW6_001174, partial [Cyclotella cf. meneghiniana]